MSISVADPVVWREVELTLSGRHPAPYTGAEVWVDFEHEDGARLRRPAF